MKTINDEIGLKTNHQWQCGNCEALNDVLEKVCPKCGLDKNKFLEVMSKRTDEQLQEVIDSPVGDYQPEAVEAAKQEIAKRSKLIKDGVLWRCEKCGVLNDIHKESCLNCSTVKGVFKDDDVEAVQLPESNTAEAALKIVGTIVLACGIVISIVLLILGICIEKIRLIILAIIPVLLSSIVTWALFRVFCNISINIKEIKKKLNEK